MWIAAKYEEIYAPTSKDFCYITDHTYTTVSVQRYLVQIDFYHLLYARSNSPCAMCF